MGGEAGFGEALGLQFTAHLVHVEGDGAPQQRFDLRGR